MRERVMVQSLDWADLRAFLVRRKWLRERIGEDIFDAICQENTSQLSGLLMRELSLYVAGYKAAKA
jgi:hypothetical protein